MNYCKYCGNEIKYVDTSKFPKDFCCFYCYEQWRRDNVTPNCICPICGKKFYLKPYRLSRVKHQPTCSRECSDKLKGEYYKGQGNPQYGLLGDKNASFDGEIYKESTFGYILEYCPNHPDVRKGWVRIWQHRLVVERNHELYDDTYFEDIDGYIHLKSEYEVHHINQNKKDNRVENLQILSKSDHMKLHQSQKSFSVLTGLPDLSKLASKKKEKLGNPDQGNPGVV